MLVAALGFSGGETEKDIDFENTVTTSQLGGDKRMAAYLSTDRDLYKPGDRLFMRCLVLEADSNVLKKDEVEATVSIYGPRGDIIAQESLYAEKGILSYAWTFPRDASGGDYSIKMSFPDYAGGYPSVERSVRVMAYRAPRIVGDLVFLKDGYYPGETVKVVGSFARAEGGVPEGARVRITATIDWEEIAAVDAVLGSDGLCEAEFLLPGDIYEDNAVVAFQVRDGSIRETLSKTIPILLDNYSIEFYPEGGELIADVLNRVYFQASFDNGKPADISGVIKNSSGSIVARAETIHEGRGFFELTPKSGEKLLLEVLGRGAKLKSFELPEAKAGFALSADELVYSSSQAITVSVRGVESKKLSLTISRREKRLAKQEFTTKPGQLSTLALLLPATAEGVLRLTLFDGNIPLAERLIYRAPSKAISVALSLSSENPVPGGSVEMRVKTTDSNGKPIAATLGLCVSDYSVQSLVEERERAPRLPTMVYLEPEVEELYDAAFYLSGEPEANLALDLLLGVQGWRRFAFYSWNDFRERYGDAADRIAALNVMYVPPKKQFFRNVMEMGMMKVQEAVPLAAPMPAGALFEDFAMDEEAGAMDEEMAVAQDFAEDAVDVDEVGKFIMDAGDEAWSETGFVAMREYAYKVRADRKPGERVDFRETIYWNAAVSTDARTGTALVRFDLNDSVTSFRVLADAISSDGRLAATETSFDSVRPFYVEAVMPTTLAKTDTLRLPLNLINNHAEAIEGEVSVYIDGVLAQKRGAELAALARSRLLFTVDGFDSSGDKTLTVKADFGVFSDTVSRSFTVAPLGFPIAEQSGGTLKPGGEIDFIIDIPSSAQDVSTKILVYPSPAANLAQALEALIRQPYGCFEQTSSTSYPLVMAQQYFLKTPGVDPALIREAQKNLEDSLGRLIGFESPEKGFEWFGDDPGHEALTAYGLMEFIEMSKVMDVEPAVIQRTKDWLLARRDGQGGYLRNQRALDSFGGAPEDTTNAYITWALVNADITGLDKEIEWLEKTAFGGDDSYVQALASYVLYKIGETAKAESLMSHLARKQSADGSVSGAVASITRSGGNSLLMETTALSLLAWLYSDQYAGNVEAAMRYITGNCQSGLFFSTQGTVLALKAIILYDEKWSRPQRAGSVEVLVNGRSVAAADFTPEDRGLIELPDLAPLLRTGDNAVTLRMKDGSTMPFTFEYSYYALVPASSEECRLRLRTEIHKTALNEGSVTGLKAIISNQSEEAAPNPIAIIGIPGGLEIRYDKLKELKAAGVIASFEIRGGELILYWRQLKAKEERVVEIDLTAVLPGSYTAPASRAYEYYNAEHKAWVEGSAVTIQ